MSASFQDASRVEAVTHGEQGTFVWRVPDGWQQGRGAFGGLVVGAMIRALGHVETDASRPLRSIAADLCGPVVPGDATLTVKTLRRGRGTTFLDVDVVQKGEVVAHASALMAGARPNPDVRAPTIAPKLAPWRDVEIAHLAPPLAPVFTQHYEYRSSVGNPFTPRGERGLLEGFVREKTPLPHLDAASMAGRIDAWWPTLFTLDPKPRPLATVAFTMQLLADPSTLSADEPLAYRAKMLSLGAGFFVELRELWQSDLCVALNPQTFAILV
jgi:hypothetical protein